jgi:hypothetical protein
LKNLENEEICFENLGKRRYFAMKKLGKQRNLYETWKQEILL